MKILDQFYVGIWPAVFLKVMSSADLAEPPTYLIEVQDEPAGPYKEGEYLSIVLLRSASKDDITRRFHLLKKVLL